MTPCCPRSFETSPNENGVTIRQSVIAWPPRMRERQMPNRRRALPLTAACITLAVPAFGAENLFDGTYTGERVLTVGDPNTCVAKDAASATIQGDKLTFTHSAIKDYTISFSPRADGERGNNVALAPAFQGHAPTRLQERPAFASRRRPPLVLPRYGRELVRPAQSARRPGVASEAVYANSARTAYLIFITTVRLKAE
jgi:hypothetical protein